MKKVHSLRESRGKSAERSEMREASTITINESKKAMVRTTMAEWY